MSRLNDPPRLDVEQALAKASTDELRAECSKRGVDTMTPEMTKAWANDRVYLRRTADAEKALDELLSARKEVARDEAGKFSLTEAERETIHKMAEFFVSSGEDEHLDPKVVAELQERFSARSTPPREVALTQALAALVRRFGPSSGYDDGRRTELAEAERLLEGATVEPRPRVFLVYDTTGETGELVAVRATLPLAEVFADALLLNNPRSNHAIDEWADDQLVRHWFRDAYGEWTSE